MRQFFIVTRRLQRRSVCGVPAAKPVPSAGSHLADASSGNLVSSEPNGLLCWPAKRGARGAGKTVVTDYRFGGPGFATPKPVGWAGPQTPQAPEGASA